MAKRSNKEDFVKYPYDPERQLKHPSGFCMTNYHQNCKYQFDHGRCGCECHTQPQKTQKKSTKVAIVADSHDPRPWMRKQ